MLATPNEELWKIISCAENGRNNHRGGLRWVGFDVSRESFESDYGLSVAEHDEFEDAAVIDDAEEAVDLLLEEGVSVVHHYISCACRGLIDRSTGRNAALSVNYRTGEDSLRTFTILGLCYEQF